MCMIPRSLLRVLLVVLDELRYNFLYGTIDHVVGNLVDWSVWIAVDGDDDT